eukprot:TRINITY_DN114511_c0_g1_i1.p1 TRINITY_DN114511_c0_g1~~TRINITY_DN114511_c0_g1_i1.p1  ORF type:complete len:196 (-),score=26.05 TRINITY_DN114511_c0_g1_i1:308-895(-)
MAAPLRTTLSRVSLGSAVTPRSAALTRSISGTSLGAKTPTGGLTPKTPKTPSRSPAASMSPIEPKSPAAVLRASPFFFDQLREESRMKNCSFEIVSIGRREPREPTGTGPASSINTRKRCSEISRQNQLPVMLGERPETKPTARRAPKSTTDGDDTGRRVTFSDDGEAEFLAMATRDAVLSRLRRLKGRSAPVCI